MAKKKADPKKSKAYKALAKIIAAVLLTLPVWLNASEVRSVLLGYGIPGEVTHEHIGMAVRGHGRGQIESRLVGNSRFFRHYNFGSNPCTPDSRDDVSEAISRMKVFAAEARFEKEVQVIKLFAKSLSTQSATPKPKQPSPKPVTPAASATTAPCRGWTGKTYENLFQVSARDFMESSLKSAPNQVPTMDSTIPLAGMFQNRKDYSCFEIDVSQETFKIRSKDCSGDSSGSSLLCDTCRGFSHSLANINAQAKRTSSNIHGSMRLNAERIVLLGPEKTASAFTALRDSKNRIIHKERQHGTRLLSQLVEAKSCQTTKDEKEINILDTVVSEALPLAEKAFGKDSINYHIFSAQLDEIQGTRTTADGKVSTGVRYNPEVISYALSLLRDAGSRVYDSLQKVLLLPDKRYLRKKAANVLGSDGDEGPCVKAIDHMVECWSSWAVENPSLSAGWDTVFVAYDSMRIAPGMILMKMKGEQNRISGAMLPESLDIATKLFDQFVYKLGLEKGLGPEEGDEIRKVSELLVQNTEHSVYYVSSANPRCDMRFIAGVYNTPAVNGKDVMKHMNEVTMALAERGLNFRVEVSDSAGGNTGYANVKCNIAAAEFIPEEVLESHGLDGNVNVAYTNYADGDPAFCIDDPPHVLKRIGNAMRNKDLEWIDEDGTSYPMSMKTLRDIFEAIVKRSDEFALRKFRKLSMGHFETGNRAQKMKVRPIAQVLSNTMVRAIDKVCDDEKIVFDKVPLPQRRKVFSKVRELCEKMNRWFDLCNSKDPTKHSEDWQVWVTPENGPEIADEFLSILKWFQDWRDAVTDQNGVVNEELFVPEATYKSLQNCCYGFASLIYVLAVEKKQTFVLDRINQDICENHFGHVRTRCGSNNHPIESHAMACKNASTEKRAVKASQKGNVTLFEKPSKKQRVN